MESTKDMIIYVLLGLSLCSNVYLVSLVRTQNHSINGSFADVTESVKLLTSTVKDNAKSTAAESSNGVSDQALLTMVNEAVRLEMSHQTPAADYSGRLQDLQNKVAGLQQKLIEHAQKAGKGNGPNSDEHLREEAMKLKQEVLAACSGN